MTRIFISYSRDDETFARDISSELQKFGIDTWLDVESILSGVNWSTAIQEGLDTCTMMLLIISSSSMESANVENEWQYYIDQKKPIIPIMYRPTKVHFQLSRLQYTDFYQNEFKLAFVALLEALQVYEVDFDSSVLDDEQRAIFGRQKTIVKDSNLDGSILISRYKLLKNIGGGRQGQIYLAQDLTFPEIERLVAIKTIQFISNDPIQKKTILTRIEREINFIAQLNHRAIPAFFDVFKQGDHTYIVMQYINGDTLESVVENTKSLPVDVVIEWALEVCGVLHYLHNHKPNPIIFRDIKPANIMIDQHGHPRLIDFGFAKEIIANTPSTNIGTEGYSAPEQYKGNATVASDIYSLGATLHHVLTRTDPRLEAPFSYSERPIKEYNPDVPDAVVTAIEKALAFNPKDRFSSMSEFRSALNLGAGSSHQVVAPSDLPPHWKSSFKNHLSFSKDKPDTLSGLSALWTYTTEDEIRATATVVGQDVIFGSYDGRLFSIKTSDGRVNWTFSTGAGIASKPEVDIDTGLILFGSEDGYFYAVTPDSGRLLWKFETEGRIRGSATALHGYAFFGNDRGDMFAMDIKTGRFAWTFNANSPIRTQPLVTQNLIIFGSNDGSLFALELDGRIKWRTKLNGTINSKVLCDDEGVCYLGSFDGYFYAIDSNTGHTMWRFQSKKPIVSSPTLHGEFVIFTATDGNVYCLNSSTSKERWTYKTPKPIVSSPVVDDKQVIFGSSDHHVYVINADSGAFVTKFKTGAEVLSSPVVDKHIVYIGSCDRKMYALRLTNSEE